MFNIKLVEGSLDECEKKQYKQLDVQKQILDVIDA